MEKFDILECKQCGHMIELLRSGSGEMICCGEPMEKLEEKTEEEGLKEKHVPVVEIEGEDVFVEIGSVEHPMIDEHHIEWIQVILGDKSYRQFLNPGEAPEVHFELEEEDVALEDLVVREHCNIHGLWKSE
jgi:superoxide reductase